MAEIINMPRLSDTMEEGTVAKWLKKVGDNVEEGDILAEIETDKATMEFESFYSGTLLHIGIQEGEGAPVDSLLAVIGEKGEDISGLLNGNHKLSDTATEKKPKAQEYKTEPGAENASLPKDVEVITMPRLSDTMEEGTVAKWLKKVGDKVEEGDILAEIETDKATMEFESFYSGTLLHIGIREGQSAPVDEVLAIIGPEGTDVTAISNAKPSSNTPKITSETEVPPAEAPKTATPATQAANSSSGEQRIFASPLAKKMAGEKGINLANIKGSGDSGRIVKRDVENYHPSQTLPAAEPQQHSVPLSTRQESTEEVKNSTMRKVIAKRLGESKFSAPHYYLTIEVDMDQAKASRTQINTLPNTKISFNDMVLKACALALKKHPQVNTSWQGNTTLYKHHIHIGVAVAVEEGLVVPVIKFADQLSFTQLGTTVKDLAEKARNKKIKPEEMEGSTFTVSNLGMFGILEFTSIINQPNSAILSVGAIVEKPVVKNGAIVIGNTMKLTLACDHRTVDGATGAQFLQTLKTYLENPVTMLA